MDSLKCNESSLIGEEEVAALRECNRRCHQHPMSLPACVVVKPSIVRLRISNIVPPMPTNKQWMLISTPWVRLNGKYHESRTPSFSTRNPE